MTRTARRLLYLGSFLVFLLIGPPLVLSTAGWHWQGWGRGFTRSGVIVISSTPRATWKLNGQTIGHTPDRQRNLATGAYQVSLERAGFQAWTQTVPVEAGLATVIGPVYLARQTPTVSQVTIRTGPGAWLLDQSQHMLFWVQSDGVTWNIQLIKPDSSSVAWQLPFAPDGAWTSPNREVIIFQGATQQAAVQVRDAAVWVMPVSTAPAWSDFSNNIWVAIQNQQATIFDALHQTATPLAAATSATFAFGDIWLTQATDQGTELLRLTYPGQSVPTSSLKRTGTLEILPLDPNLNGLLLRNPASHETEAWLGSARPPVTGIQIGSVDQLFWSNRNQPPLWLGGVDVATLIDGQRVLLTRSPQDYQALAWVVPEHALLTIANSHLTLSSISSRQGRGTIATYPLPNGAIILTDAAAGQAWVAQPNGKLESWRWH